jgi:hypothetical protein
MFEITGKNQDQTWGPSNIHPISQLPWYPVSLLVTCKVNVQKVLRLSPTTSPKMPCVSNTPQTMMMYKIIML